MPIIIQIEQFQSFTFFHSFLIRPISQQRNIVYCIIRGSCICVFYLLLLFLTAPIITCWVGLHGHFGEEVLKSTVAKIIAHLSKLQEKPAIKSSKLVNDQVGE